MNLNIEERLQIQLFLPTEGSLVDMGACYNILTKVDFTAEETERFELKIEGDHINWSEEKDEEKHIELSLNEKMLLIKTLEKKDMEETLSYKSLNLYNKINDLKNG